MNEGAIQCQANRNEPVAEALTDMIAIIQNRLLEFNGTVTAEMEWVNKGAYKQDMEWVLENLKTVRDYINNE